MASTRLGKAALGAAILLASLAACKTSAGQAAPLPTLTTPTMPATTAPSTADPTTQPVSPTSTSLPVQPTPTPTKVVTPVGQPRPPSGKGPAGSMITTGSSGVALTFDDGPDPTNTPKMLDLLRKHRVKATFCLVGKLAAAHPKLVAQIAAEGHTLCNHSWAHDLKLAKKSDEEIRKDLADTNRAIRKAVPNAKIEYFRAPGGNFDHRLVKIAASLGMKSLYWSVDTRDWQYSKYGHGKSMVDHVVATVKANVTRGSIVLAHDAYRPDTITAFAQLLPWLKARYRLIALPTGGDG